MAADPKEWTPGRPTFSPHFTLSPRKVRRLASAACFVAGLILVVWRTMGPLGTAASAGAESRGSPWPAAQNERSGRSQASYWRRQLLSGGLFSKARGGSLPEKMVHAVSWSVLSSFSPSVEDHVQDMFQDKFGECMFHALGPAVAKWNGVWVANIRLFLPQYVLTWKSGPDPMDTWQENYIYNVLLDDDYKPVGVGRLLGVPTTTNAMADYRKDGPLDPRAFVFKNRLFLVYYAYGRPAPDSGARCRMYLWDYEKSVKRMMTVTGLTIQKPADINWVPLVSRDELYFIYTLDPLRVLRCDPDSGRCRLHYSQVLVGEHIFSRKADHLRGGTPFVEYEHPFHVSVAHSTLYRPGKRSPSYRVHLVVLRVDTWRVVYVSEDVKAHDAWLASTPLVSETYVDGYLWYPTSIIVKDRDTFDIGCHLNDHSSYMIRLEGMKSLMKDVIDETLAPEDDVSRSPETAQPRAIQYFIESTCNCTSEESSGALEEMSSTHNSTVDNFSKPF